MKKRRPVRKSTTRGKTVNLRVPRRRNPHRYDQPSHRPFALTDWGDTRDAAIYTNTNEEFLRRMVRRGQLPAHAVNGEGESTGAPPRRRPTSRPKPRLRRQDLDAWLMAGRVSAKLAAVSSREPVTGGDPMSNKAPHDARAVSLAQPPAAWMDAKQAGAYMDGLTGEFVRDLARRGLLRGYKVRGTGEGIRGKWRFKASDCDRYIEKGVRSVA
jgi:hypothetical protein